jgi:hypothetical protein
MRPISEVFLVSKPTVSVNRNMAESGSPETTKSEDLYIKRVSRKELELAYCNDPIIFNSINKIVQIIMSGTYEISCKDKRVEKYFKEFVQNIGNSGDIVTWNSLLESIFKNSLIFGCSFVENIFNKKKNRVVDWDIIDSKKMDYAKDSYNNVVIDFKNSPVGYFQLLNYSSTSVTGAEKVLNNTTASLPVSVTRPMEYPDSIFLPKEKVSQIKFSKVGDGFYPVGLVEPIYKTSLRKMNIEESYASSVYRHANPILVGKLGDLNHQPTPAQITGVLDKLKNLNSRNEIAIPYYYDLHYLQSSALEKMRDNLEYFIAQEISGLGVTYAIATGSNDTSSPDSLGNQSSIFSLTIKQIIDSVCLYIKKEMFATVCKYEGFDEVPDLVWDINTEMELNDKASRIMKYAQAGMLTYDKQIEETIRKSEGFKLK